MEISRGDERKEGKEKRMKKDEDRCEGERERRCNHGGREEKEGESF